MMPLAHPADLAVLANTGWLNNKATEVYKQLLPDFPPLAIDWVKHTTWLGPLIVPIDQIDTKNIASWKATHEPEKVIIHEGLIKSGKSHPIILSQLLNNPKYVILDAHHRFLAYDMIGENPVCYIGIVRGNDIEQALTMHSRQLSGRSRLDGI